MPSLEEATPEARDMTISVDCTQENASTSIQRTRKLPDWIIQSSKTAKSQLNYVKHVAAHSKTPNAAKTISHKKITGSEMGTESIVQRKQLLEQLKSQEEQCRTNIEKLKQQEFDLKTRHCDLQIANARIQAKIFDKIKQLKQVEKRRSKASKNQ